MGKGCSTTGKLAYAVDGLESMYKRQAFTSQVEVPAYNRRACLCVHLLVGLGCSWVSGKHDYKPEIRKGKHAHRAGKHAMWWSAGWVSMPTEQASMPCDGVLVG